MYHSISEVSHDPWSLCVTRRHFMEQLEVLGKYARPVRLNEFVQDVERGNNKPPKVVLTFDDGYANNLHNAKPLLEQYDTPATVFVVTGYLGQEREFWWDELERLLLQPGVLPGSLSLRIDGSLCEWQLGAAVYLDARDIEVCRFWRVGESSSHPRYSLYYELWTLLKRLCDKERRELLDEIRAWCGAPAVCRPSHRQLSLGELITLSQGGLVEIGSHSVTHPHLSMCPPSLQEEEIRESKMHLEAVIGRCVTAFAYPHGDYNIDTVLKVQECGFDCACSGSVGPRGVSLDRFQLPRVAVQDWDGDEFARQLSKWFNSPSDL